MRGLHGLHRLAPLALLALAALFLALPTPADPLPRLQQVRTRYYLLHSDIDDALLYDLGRRLDAMHAEYSRRMSDFDLRTDRKPLDVFLFKSRSDYVRFTAGKYGNTGGVFIPGKNQLAAFLDGQRDTLRRTLQHEAFHQFAFKAVGPNMPVWLNEGLAQLFEEGICTGDQFLMQQAPPRRVRQLQEDLRRDRLVPFRKLMALTPERWAANLAADPDAGAVQYNQAWGMVHYMAYGDGGRNGARLVTLLRALADGRDGERAFAEAFGADVEGFRVGFDKYARSLQPTPEAALIDRHEVLADLCGQLAGQGRRFKDVAEFRRAVERNGYRLKYTRGPITWTAEPAGYFRDAGGRLLAADQLLFDPRKGAPLPDLVYQHPSSRIALRARFYIGEARRIEHEVLAEDPGGVAGVE